MSVFILPFADLNIAQDFKRKQLKLHITIYRARALKRTYVLSNNIDELQVR